jgi:hypothetical protein
MTIYEYKVEVCSISNWKYGISDELRRDIARETKDGWRLISVATAHTTHRSQSGCYNFYLFLERKLSHDDDELERDIPGFREDY